MKTKINLKSQLNLKNIFLLIIVGLGLFLRLQGVLFHTFAFTYDVGRDMLAVSQIVHNHKFPLIGPTTGLPGLFYGPWWYYLLTIPFILSAGNPEGIALYMALIGTATIVLGYFVGKKIGGELLGLILSAFTSFSPVMISLSSQIWNPNIAPFFVMIVLLVLFYLFSTPKEISFNPKLFLFLGLLLGLLIDLEVVFGILFFISIIISLIIIVRKKITLLQVILFLAGIFIMFLPRIYFEIRHQFIMTKSILSLAHMSTTGQHASFISILWTRILFIHGLWQDSLFHGITGISIVSLLCIFTIYIYFYTRMTLIQRKFLLTIVITLMTYVISLTLFSHDIWPHYVVGLPVILILLCSLSITLLANAINKKIITGILLLILFWINLQPLQLLNSLQNTSWEGDTAIYRNQVAVVDYVYLQAKGEKFKYIVYTPPVYDYPYQYLFTWYGEKTYKYIPETNKAKLFFVIIEPDTQYPFRLQKWLDDRKNDGKIIKQEKLKGGILVQTRID